MVPGDVNFSRCNELNLNLKVSAVDIEYYRVGHIPSFSSRFVNGKFQPLKKEKFQVAVSFIGKNGTFVSLMVFSLFLNSNH